MKLQIKMILASDLSGNIGYKNSLPWPYNKFDMDFFKKETAGCPVIMGRKTYESLPNKLAGRKHCVLSSDFIESQKIDYNILLKNKSVKDIYSTITYIANMENKDVFYIIGGKQTYELLEPITDEIIHTRFLKEYKGDVKIDIRNLTLNFERFFLEKNSHESLEIERYKRI